MQTNVFDRTVFTKEDKEMLSNLVALSGSLNYIGNNTQHILIRTNTLSLPGNLDTFVINTSAHPEDEIYYTVSVDRVDLSVRDGGFF